MFCVFLYLANKLHTRVHEIFLNVSYFVFSFIVKFRLKLYLLVQVFKEVLNRFLLYYVSNFFVFLSTSFYTVVNS